MSHDNISKYTSLAAKRWSGFGPSIFSEMTELAKTHNAINLGQGFPDFQGPKELLEAIKAQLDSCHNQYAPSAGELPLRAQVARYIEKSTAVSYDPLTEITITCGASEALFCTISAFINPGDKVILFEPAFDLYYQAIANAGGVVCPVKLFPPDTPQGKGSWSIDWSTFDSHSAAGYKAIIVNTPHNPTGKIFSWDELERIGKSALKNGAVLISDEVYENLFFEEDRPYVSLCSFPAFQRLLVRISSSAKTFGFTGLKIGWVTAPEALTKLIRIVHQATVFCVNPALQLGIATVMEKWEWFSHYLETQRVQYKVKRDILQSILERYGFLIGPCHGTFFLMANFENLAPNLTDREFAKQFVETQQIAAIPLSPFYSAPPKNLPWVRFAFCKQDPTLRSVGQLLLSE